MSDGLSEVELTKISQLVYLDIIDSESLSKIYFAHHEKITVGEVIQYYRSPEGQELIKERYPKELNGQNEYELWNNFLKQIDTPEYQNWEITNIVSHNKKEESGFVAYTVNTGDANVVAFRGSEPMEKPLYRNDWKNNGTTAYAIESLQQGEAEDYINSLNLNGNKLYLTGHSLGGNLALYSSFVLPDRLRKQFESASTFNAPGFNGDVLNKYRDVIDQMNREKKLLEFRNRYDIVPALFKNPSEGIYIDSLSKEFSVLSNHSLFSYKMDGANLERSNTQTRGIVPNIVHNITVGLEVVPNFLKEMVVQETFKILDGDFDIRHILFAAAAVAAIIVAPGAVLLGAVRALLGLYVIGFVIDKVIPWIQQGLENIKERITAFFHESVDFITRGVKDAVNAAKVIGSQVEHFLQGVRSAVSDFFKKMKEGFNRFVDNTVQYMKEQKDYWTSLKDKAVQKMSDVLQSVKSKIIKEKDEFVAGVRSFRQKLSQLKVKFMKAVTTAGVAAAGIARGARILANLDRLEDLQRGLSRKEESITELINRIVSLASGVSSEVGRSYSESYVQAQLSQLQSLCAQVRSEQRRISDTILKQSSALKYTIAQYREVEAKLATMARMVQGPGLIPSI